MQYLRFLSYPFVHNRFALAVMDVLTAQSSKKFHLFVERTQSTVEYPHLSEMVQRWKESRDSVSE